MKPRIALLALLASPFLLAQNIDEVVVTASPLEQTAGSIATGFNQISGDDIRQQAALNLADLAHNEPGLNPTSFGPGAGSALIRGQGGRRVTTARQGQPIIDVSSTSADHAVGDEIFHTQSIEILRGPATLRYGPGAIGGVINLVENGSAPDNGSSGRFDLSHNGNNDGNAVNAELGLGLQGLALRGGFTIRDTGNIQISGLADRGVDDPDETTDGYLGNSYNQSESGWAKLFWSGSNWNASLRLDQLNSEYGIPQGAHEHHHEEGHDEDHADDHGDDHGDEDGQEEEATVFIDMSKWSVTPSLSIENPTRWINRLDVMASFSDYEHAEIEMEEGIAEIGTRFENSGFSLRSEAVHNLWGGEGYLGLETRSNDFSASGAEAFVPSSDFTTSGIYAVQRYALTLGELELGARVDQQRIESDAAGEITHRPFNLGLSYLFDLNDSNRIGFSVTRAQRAPDATELLAEGEHVATSTYEIGDANLKKESSNSVELSYRYNGLVSYALSLYHNDFGRYTYAEDTGLLFNHDLHDDQGLDGLAACTNETGFDDAEEAEEANGCFAYRQQGANFKGFEISMSIPLGEALSMKLWTDRVDAKLDNGERVPRMPPQRVGVSLGYQASGMSASLNAVKAHEQGRLAPNESATDGYFRLDARIARQWDNLTLFLSGKNLTNQDIRLSTSYLKDVAPEPGRSIVAGASFSF